MGLELDLSDGLEKFKVCVESGLTLSEFHGIRYCIRNIPSHGSDPAAFEETFLGCNCQKVCQTSCLCIGQNGPTYDTKGKILHYNNDTFCRPVIECNTNCTCSEACRNRVVQKGIIVQNLQVFNTKTKGYGLKTTESIEKSCFVCEYAGEVLTYHEAKQRAMKLKPTDMNYILALKEHLSDDRVLHTYVDPTYIGNAGRYINHSCDPNLIMVPVRVGNNIPRLALFAARDIEVDEELCYDYSGICSVINHTDEVESTAEHMKDTSSEYISYQQKVCNCLSKNCKGFLPFDPSLYK